MFVDRPRPIPNGSLLRADVGTGPGLRSQRGLGRDLAAILETSLDREAPAVGLNQLLGERRPSTPSVRRFVVEVALAAIAEAFEADAIVLARRRHDGEPPVVSARLPPSWDDESGLKFELVGRVWRLLEEGPPTRHDVGMVDELHTWIGGFQSDEARLGAAISRRTPFTGLEQTALARVVRSVASAVDDEPPPLPNGSRLTVSLSSIVLDDPSNGSGIRALVALRGGGERRTAVADAADADLAVARAAVELAGSPGGVSVSFAGRASVEDMSVSIVVLDRLDDAPQLGLVVSDSGCGAGPAEAVFAALAG
jgi:hypothetical protein